jgi:hypothetical protein
MKKIVASIAIITSILLLTADQALAQSEMMRWRHSGGWGSGSQYSRLYDPQTLETISGKIVSIERMTPMQRMSHGIRLMVKTAKETISVHLGPEWYVTNQDIQLQPNERVKIKGSRIIFNDKPAIIAAEVKKGDKILTLRDSDGLPLWSGCCRQR